MFGPSGEIRPFCAVHSTTNLPSAAASGDAGDNIDDGNALEAPCGEHVAWIRFKRGASPKASFKS